MITVETQHPIATESLDHIHPEGIYYDNNLNIWWVENAEKYFGAGKGGRKLNFLDLGCAGCLLVRAMHERGHTAVGLEGSDHCLNIRPEMVEEVGQLPYGHENWKIHGNKILFTCDVTKEYTIRYNGELLKFDLISCWDVIEHFEPEELDTFFGLVDKHLADNGIFVGSIALIDAPRMPTSKNTPANLNYHKSLFTANWWDKKLAQYFTKMDYFSVFGGCTNRVSHPSTISFAVTKKK